MRHYPIFMDIQNLPCLVVGGGDVAARKARALIRAGARVRVIAPTLSASMRKLEKKVEVSKRTIEDSDIGGHTLIIAATSDAAVNRHISELAREQGIQVNVADAPELCSFIMPSIVDRSPVVIAISSGGSAPVLARTLRARLETLVPASYGKLAELMESYRSKLPEYYPDEKSRRKFWEWVVHGPIAEMIFSGRPREADAEMERALTALPQTLTETPGEVWLVGAGPGDPDLLTFRALRLMQQADVVLHDRLVSEGVLDLCRRDAERIYVGKRRAGHSVSQPDINKLLVELAQKGNRVVRLKGGDPFMFGRGGEEIGELAEAGIPFQVVPGITAASGCSTYAGIPLTHRDHAQSCLFVTGHLKDGSVDLDWQQMARPNQTVVVFMGLVGLPVICKKLVEAGVSKDMPVALVERGTTTDQRVLTGTLDTLPVLVEKNEVHAPTTIIIGTVVTLRENLAWYESGPVR